MNYKGMEHRNFVLAHALTGARRNGKERANHKYIKREWNNGRWAYTYKDDISSRGNNRNAPNPNDTRGYATNRANIGNTSETRKGRTAKRVVTRTATAKKGYVAKTKELSENSKAILSYQQHYGGTARAVLPGKNGWDSKVMFDSGGTNASFTERYTTKYMASIKALYAYNKAADYVKDKAKDIFEKYIKPAATITMEVLFGVQSSAVADGKEFAESYMKKGNKKR